MRVRLFSLAPRIAQTCSTSRGEWRNRSPTRVGGRGRARPARRPSHAPGVLAATAPPPFMRIGRPLTVTPSADADSRAAVRIPTHRNSTRILVFLPRRSARAPLAVVDSSRRSHLAQPRTGAISLLRRRQTSRSAFSFHPCRPRRPLARHIRHTPGTACLHPSALKRQRSRVTHSPSCAPYTDSSPETNNYTSAHVSCAYEEDAHRPVVGQIRASRLPATYPRSPMCLIRGVDWGAPTGFLAPSHAPTPVRCSLPCGSASRRRAR